MEYHSTAGKSAPVNLKTAILSGLAPDGGLYMPASIPRLPKAFFNNMSEMSIPEIAYVVANTLFGDSIDSATLKNIVDDALNFDIPLVPITDRLYGVELFHGPTHSFKDVGTRFMSRILRFYCDANGRNKICHCDGLPVNIVVATSGNGGSAVAREGLAIPGAHTFVLYPAGKLAQVEIAQFATLGPHVHALEVSGDFNTCHSIAMSLLADPDIQRITRLVSANSVNIAQLMPQVFYYFYAYAQLVQREELRGDLVMGVPSGNLGNLAGGVVAKLMGLPVKRFVTAGNHFVLSHFTGSETREMIDEETIKDVARTANFDRVVKMYGDSISRLSDDVATYHCSDRQIADTINNLYMSTGYLTEPNAAAVIGVMQSELRPTETGVVLLPTHPAKKADVINFITGQCVNIPHDLADVCRRQRVISRVPATVAAVRKYILDTLNKQL